jgi:hypothetical protein
MGNILGKPQLAKTFGVSLSLIQKVYTEGGFEPVRITTNGCEFDKEEVRLAVIQHQEGEAAKYYSKDVVKNEYGILVKSSKQKS